VNTASCRLSSSNRPIMQSCRGKVEDHRDQSRRRDGERKRVRCSHMPRLSITLLRSCPLWQFVWHSSLFPQHISPPATSLTSFPKKRRGSPALSLSILPGLSIRTSNARAGRELSALLSNPGGELFFLSIQAAVHFTSPLLSHCRIGACTHSVIYAIKVQKNSLRHNEEGKKKTNQERRNPSNTHRIRSGLVACFFPFVVIFRFLFFL